MVVRSLSSGTPSHEWDRLCLQGKQGVHASSLTNLCPKKLSMTKACISSIIQVGEDDEIASPPDNFPHDCGYFSMPVVSSALVSVVTYS